MGYFGRSSLREKLIKGSGIPYSDRSSRTQIFAFLGAIAQIRDPPTPPPPPRRRSNGRMGAGGGGGGVCLRLPSSPLLRKMSLLSAPPDRDVALG
jgi:hypothetical protein